MNKNSIFTNVVPNFHTFNHYILQQTALIFIQLSVILANLEVDL